MEGMEERGGNRGIINSDKLINNGWSLFLGFTVYAVYRVFIANIVLFLLSELPFLILNLHHKWSVITIPAILIFVIAFDFGSGYLYGKYHPLNLPRKFNLNEARSNVIFFTLGFWVSFNFYSWAMDGSLVSTYGIDSILLVYMGGLFGKKRITQEIIDKSNENFKQKAENWEKFNPHITRKQAILIAFILIIPFLLIILLIAYANDFWR
ncbi:hypothetical protein BMS3Abin16_00260 [archaeon BMS3Abin16]|nr:hypothetical protein BMS3Abin16_00260 [archaeon BMS3Abin16]GBE56162.1 hypothetical protein BMS3Bbin16_00361 [archaeon BMS3Bbin16]HDY74220.1 hypothetical protein [Euryarchaeota archaeon]